MSNTIHNWYYIAMILKAISQNTTTIIKYYRKWLIKNVTMLLKMLGIL